MTIQAYINNLEDKYNNYIVNIDYFFKLYCYECGKSFLQYDDEYSIKTEDNYTVKDIKENNTIYHKEYDFIFCEDLEEAKKDSNKNTIYVKIHREDTTHYICDMCK